MADKHIAQQSVVGLGSLCIIHGCLHEENNGLTVVVESVYFDCGEWWVDVTHCRDEIKLLYIDENDVKHFVDRAAFPAKMMMTIGQIEMENV